VAHDEEEADPWHVRALAQVLCDAIGAGGAEAQREEATPQVEESDQIKHGGAARSAGEGWPG